MSSMPGMNSTMSSMMPSTMKMVFFTSSTTTLYSDSWTPTTTSQYAGTCIFLIVLATVFRSLVAFKSKQERRWTATDLQRRILGSRVSAFRRDDFDRADGGAKVDGPIPRDIALTRYPRPWRLSVDVPRAAFDVVIAGLGYLLMLAVMTMNVGYFMSILGGIFLGSLLSGRFETRHL